MKVEIVIENLNGGFFDASTSTFRGYLFATKYPSKEGLGFLSDLSRASAKEPCKVTEIYSN